MKHQQVSVDYWAMGKSMLTYGALSALVWLLLRMIIAVFTLPRRLRNQQQSIEQTLKELQKRYPDLDITAEDLKNAEKEFEELMKENSETTENKEEDQKAEITDKTEGDEQPPAEEAEKEDKKTI